VTFKKLTQQEYKVVEGNFGAIFMRFITSTIQIAGRVNFIDGNVASFIQRRNLKPYTKLDLLLKIMMFHHTNFHGCRYFPPSNEILSYFSNCITYMLKHLSPKILKEHLYLLVTILCIQRANNSSKTFHFPHIHILLYFN